MQDFGLPCRFFVRIGGGEDELGKFRGMVSGLGLIAPAREPDNEAGEQYSASSPDIVVNAIIRGVRAGRLVPGQRLVEADLTRNLGVSRGPVREALKRLAAEGVVTLNRHRGAYVRALTRNEVRDTLMVLEVLTGLVARLAAQHIGEDRNRVRFEAEYRRLMAFREQGDSISFLDQRRAYYDALIAIGGNRELERLMPLMQIHLLRLQFQSYVTPRQREKQFQEYEAISQAVLSSNQRLSERLMQLHIRRTRLVLTRLPEEAFASGQL
jgi:DNA-binding GntR family transcriptional regulator